MSDLLIVDRASPNHEPRPKGATVDMLILHYTGMRSCEEAMDRLCDPEAKVSAHYCIDEDGRIVRLVPETERAWHAGQSCWAGERDVNGRSIGIELVNPGHDFGYRDFPEAQIASLEALAREIVSRHPIRPSRVLAHSDIAPGRKQDPGEKFPWERLAEHGLGLWPDVTPARTSHPALRLGHQGPKVRGYQKSLALFGYDISPMGIFDDWTRLVTIAFQRRYLPHVIGTYWEGCAGANTRKVAKWLSRRA